MGVVIPTRNRPESLGRALASVIDQTTEIVIVDEASHPPVSETLGPVPSHVRIIRNEHPLGPGAARNLGARALATEFLGFLDDDDEWLPGKVEACLVEFRAHVTAGMVMHRAANHLDDARPPVRGVLLHDPPRYMVLHQPPHVDCVLVRTAVHRMVEFDETFPAAADLDYMVRIARTAPVVLLDRVLAVHSPGGPIRSDVALSNRIAGRRMFREKHGDLFDRRADAFYALRLGHQLRRAGHRVAAAQAFVRSIVKCPGDARAWKGLLAVALPESLVVLRTRTRRP